MNEEGHDRNGEYLIEHILTRGFTGNTRLHNLVMVVVRDLEEFGKLHLRYQTALKTCTARKRDKRNSLFAECTAVRMTVAFVNVIHTRFFQTSISSLLRSRYG